MSENTKKDQVREPELKPVAPYKPGEKGFAVFWLIIGAVFFYFSMQIYQKHPGVSSAGAVPLFCTGAIILCSVLILLSDRKAPSENDGAGGGEKAANVFRFLFGPDVLFMVIMIFLYCIALNMRLGFYPATLVFLWISMIFYNRSKFRVNGSIDTKILGKVILHNLFWTAVCLAFIFVVFSTLFKVVLP